ncbi:MAG TPA: vWA domain-containing protein [Ktedonobacterales bacterium]
MATLVSTAAPAFAQPLTPARAQRASGAAASGHVTILVIDMSGSMGSPGQGGNDPNGLRCSAAHAYIDLSGTGQWVGIVGLAHPAGAPGDPRLAQDYAQPVEMSTDAARAAMRKALDTQSNNCVGDGTTPMSDALLHADHMLHSATQGTLAGSVILLTDGLPDPDTNGQIAAIQQELPDFETHNWPIDTIALGDADRGFLSGLSDATGGRAFDVRHGPVPGDSPLNLEPFFLSIFQINAGRTLLHAVAPLALAGQSQRQFHVGRFVAHMDVLVVRDSSNVSALLYAPGNYPNAPEQPGQARIVENDPHYAIFAVDSPVRGDWTLAFSGSGQLLVDALIQSTLSLQLVSPHANQHLPMGLGLAFNASLRDGSDQVLAEPVTLTATLTPANGASPTSQEVPLTDPGGSSPTGNFQGRVTVPASAPRGTYLIELRAQLNDAEANLLVPVVFEPFPVPTLLSPSTGKAQLAGLALNAVPSAPLTIAFGLTVGGTLQAEPGVSATLAAGGQPVALTASGGSWQGTYVPNTNGAQPLLVRLTGTYHGTDLAAWPYTLPLTIALRPSLVVQGIDARRPYPAHRTLPLTLAYFRQAGVPDPAAAGHITVALLPPNGIGVPLALQPALDAKGQPQPGAYTAAVAFGDPGTYTLRAIFDDGVATDHSEQLFVLRVIDFPVAMTADVPPGQTLTSWGPLGGLYGLPVVGWFAAPALGGQPNLPTAVVRGQVLLSGKPYSGGALSAMAYPVSGGRSIPATVTLNGNAYTAAFHPAAPGAYQVVVTWTGDFAGVRADQEPTTNQIQLAIVGPSALGWGQAWLVTLLYLLIVLALVQLGRFGATPAPAGAMQASGKPDEVYPFDHNRAPLWRRYLWRNRLRTSDIGLPPGAVLRFRRARGPVVMADVAVRDAAVTVGGAELRPGAPPVELEGAVLAFGQGALDLDGDEDDGYSARVRATGRRGASRQDEALPAQYVYRSPSEMAAHEEANDPWMGVTAAADEAGDPYDEPTRRPASALGRLGAFLALFRPAPRGAADDEFGDMYDDERPARGKRGRARRDEPDEFGDLDLDAPPRRRTGGQANGERDPFDDLDGGRPSRTRAGKRNPFADDLDDRDLAPRGRSKTRRQPDAFDDW